MCGIVGYVGKNEAIKPVIDGLKALEYRGYDSAGISLISKGKPVTVKQVGRVEALEQLLHETFGRSSDSGLELISSNGRGTQARRTNSTLKRVPQGHSAEAAEKSAEFLALPESRLAGPGCEVAIGHTRWATHGAPSITNAHPHFNSDQTILAVHNGIIENYQEIRSKLQKVGYKFVSETDTEVIPHLIDYYMKSKLSFADSFRQTIKDLKGAYAIAAINSAQPDTIFVARLSSPLVIGVGNGEHFLASDATAIMDYTKKVIYLDDYEVAEITPKKVNIHNIQKAVAVQRAAEELDFDHETAALGDYPHFMLKEIHEAPQTIQSAIRGRIKALDESAGASYLDVVSDLSSSSAASGTGSTVREQRKGKSGNTPEAIGGVAGSAREQANAIRGSYTVKLGGLDSVKNQLQYIDRIVIVACGTSFYAGLVGEYLIEELAGIPVEVQLASEFKYRNEPFSRSTALIAISQSGETADTIAALRKVEDYGVLRLGIVNAVGSTIARITDAGVYCHAGPEQSVASTKAFIAQVTVLAEIALHLSDGRTPLYKPVLQELLVLPEKAKEVLQQAKDIQKLAKKYSGYRDFLYLGRNYAYPCALEGALKLKEISYIHAEGFAAGEMKHGPLAMIDKDFPAFVIACKSPLLEKTLSNIEEIKARKGPVLAIGTKGYKQLEELVKDVIYIPDTLEQLQPLLVAIVLQLFSYYVAVEKDLNVDRPRNLAKSVTVE